MPHYNDMSPSERDKQEKESLFKRALARLKEGGFELKDVLEPDSELKLLQVHGIAKKSLDALREAAREQGFVAPGSANVRTALQLADRLNSNNPDFDDCTDAALMLRGQKAAIDWLRRESNLLGNLLAVIHRDGGQYVRGFGLEQACADAEIIVAELIAIANKP